MLVMVVFFIAFRWIHLSTPLIGLFLLVLILLLMPTLNFFPVWLAFSLLRLRLSSQLPIWFIFCFLAMSLVFICLMNSSYVRYVRDSLTILIMMVFILM